MGASHIEKSIDVDVPPRTAYNQWNQFSEFPKFMNDVKEVKQLDEKRILWRADIRGNEAEWLAVITEQIPDTRIAWRSVEGTKNSGDVSFHRLSEGSTRVIARISYEPEGLVESAGDVLGIVTQIIETSLANFKYFVEQRHQETGGWKSEITRNKE